MSQIELVENIQTQGALEQNSGFPSTRNLNNNFEAKFFNSKVQLGVAKSVSERSSNSSGSRSRGDQLRGTSNNFRSSATRFNSQSYPNFRAEPSSPAYWPSKDPSSRPVLSSQQSYLLQPKPVLLSDSSMQGVDENIYHWKVLNLSRAKLKASSRTSALLSGFAMVAMVEINIDKQVPLGLLITFAVCTVLLIAVHMLALMISTCILPNVEAVANLHFQTQKTVFESPHMKMSFIVELAWGFSTVLGILLFLVEIAILCWMKFYTISHEAAWVATGLLIPIFIIFIAFAAMFYLKLVSHKSEVYESGIKELQLLKEQLEADNGEGADESTALAGGGSQNLSSPNSARSALHIV